MYMVLDKQRHVALMAYLHLYLRMLVQLFIKPWPYILDGNVELRNFIKFVKLVYVTPFKRSVIVSIHQCIDLRAVTAAG